MSGRNLLLTREAGRLRRLGRSPEEIEAELLSHPGRNGLPPAEIRAIARSIGAKPPGPKIERPADGWRSALHELADRRGWPVAALKALGAIAKGAEVHLPMKLADGRVVGWRRRRADNQLFKGAGKKALTVKGGKAMLIMPEALPPDIPFAVTESETDAAAIIAAGHHAVLATPGGNPSSGCIAEAQKVAAGRTVVLFPDPDKVGDAWRSRVGTALIRAGCTARYVPPVDCDIDARLRRDHDPRDSLARLISGAIPLTESKEIPSGGEKKAPSDEASRLSAVETFIQSDDPTKLPRPRPQTDILIDIGLNVSKALFCGDDDRPYAVIRDRSEVWGVRSKRFREWLRGCYFTKVSKGANANSVRDAVETIAAKAQFSSDKRKVFLRTAEAGGKLYVDLTDDDWRVVEIDANGEMADGWRVLDQSPVMFTRRGSQAPLPVPERGGSLSDLWPFLNVPEKNRPLIAGWLLAALYPSGPYPILVLQGEEGTAKTTAAIILRSLCDPAMVPLRAPTRDEKDFLVGCIGNWCVCLDNLSGMQPWMSDALCRLSTGGGFAARTLYTDCDETAIQIQRPVILNGADVGAVRGDLISRTVALTLSTIIETQRREPDELMLGFEKARPRILGVLFTALAQAVREKLSVKLMRKPRMAGFARLVIGAETALGFERGAFMAVYRENLAEGAMGAIEASPVAQAIVTFMADRQEWEGTATDLLKAITPSPDDRPRAVQATWPANGRGMSAALTRLAPALRRVEIHVEHLERVPGKGTRPLRLARKVPAQPSQPSQPSDVRDVRDGAADASDGEVF